MRASRGNGVAKAGGRWSGSRFPKKDDVPQKKLLSHLGSRFQHRVMLFVVCSGRRKMKLEASPVLVAKLRQEEEKARDEATTSKAKVRIFPPQRRDYGG